LRIFDNVFTPESSFIALDILIKLGLAVLMGGAIGLERERSGRPAGIRTHMLLVLGVVLICEVSKAFDAVDHSRIAAQIVTGVGFLGAGTILRTGVEVKGLTTAASLWAVSAIGFAISTGGAFLIVAAVATLLTLFTLAVVDNIERRLAPGGHLRDLTVRLESKDMLNRLVDTLEAGEMRVESVRIVQHQPELVAQMGVFGDRKAVMSACLKSEGVLGADMS
jgi:putative Mg2+ transporter-C (MgtC) family protein